MDARVATWGDEEIDWIEAPPTVVRSTWDYHERRDAFLAWTRSVPSIHNAPELLRWSSDKRYLLEIADRVPVVPTRLVERPERDTLQEALGEAGWTRAVLKPTIGLDGYGVRTLEADDLPDDIRASGPTLLQPLVGSAAAFGEVSVVFVEGRATHAVLRTPPPHDFRAQERLGGRVRAHEPAEDVVAVARRAVGLIDPEPLYARVDVVRWEGAAVVMELELVEPSLFLAFHTPAFESMADAIERLLT